MDAFLCMDCNFLPTQANILEILFGARPQGSGHRNEKLPAMYTSEEHSLSFIRRPHLPGMVNHPFLVTAGTTPVRLKSSATAKQTDLIKQTSQTTESLFVLKQQRQSSFLPQVP